jgi:putative aminopeptidase FrvX
MNWDLFITFREITRAKTHTMENRYHYASVLKALKELKAMDFVVDFNLQEEVITNNPNHYEILHIYRYEGESNPDDEAIVYGIMSNKGEKGVFVAGFSANSENEAAKVLHELSIKGNKH